MKISKTILMGVFSVIALGIARVHAEDPKPGRFDDLPICSLAVCCDGMGGVKTGFVGCRAA